MHLSSFTRKLKENKLLNNLSIIQKTNKKRGIKMKHKKKKKPVPPVTIIGDAVTREIIKIKAIKG